MRTEILPYSSKARELSKKIREDMTNAEKELWCHIRNRALGIKFQRQFPILDYVVDFYAKEVGLAIEVDGKIHLDNTLEDGLRQKRIEELGVSFIRFTNEEVLTNISAVLKSINAFIKNT